MPRVICIRPNAADNINGVPFHKHDMGVISDEIAIETAAQFLDISGYFLEGANLELSEDEDNDSTPPAGAAVAAPAAPKKPAKAAKKAEEPVQAAEPVPTEVAAQAPAGGDNLEVF